ALILEEYEHARKRGARIYAEVAGGGMSADAYHLTATHPEGKGAMLGMQWALEDAGVSPGEVDYLNPHATSTPMGDVSEMKAVTAFFGKTAGHLHISATKSATGHMLGAAGAAEALICIKTIHEGIIPPTINTTNLDPAMPPGLNVVLGQPLRKDVRVALSNTFGFGGHNASAVFRKI
ncbi:MAG TPA: beta-ketoacyl-[acyl-carrier-protein] synthase II, partial [Chryseosolibacter sp.]